VDKRCGGIKKKRDSLIPEWPACPAPVWYGACPAGWEEKNGFDTCCDDEMDRDPKYLSERMGPSRSKPDEFS